MCWNDRFDLTFAGIAAVAPDEPLPITTETQETETAEPDCWQDDGAFHDREPDIYAGTYSED